MDSCCDDPDGVVCFSVDALRTFRELPLGVSRVDEREIGSDDVQSADQHEKLNGNVPQPLARPIDVHSVVDPQNQNLAFHFIDLVDDPVRTPAGSPKTLKLSMKHVTDLLRIFQERSEEKLDHRVSGFVGESCEDPLG
jgi:hypothetical protein